VQADSIALELLKKMNLPIEGLRSKNWDEFAVPAAPTLDRMKLKDRLDEIGKTPLSDGAT